VSHNHLIKVYVAATLSLCVLVSARAETRIWREGLSDRELAIQRWFSHLTFLQDRSAENDSVVPIKNALVLAESAQLDEPHHVRVFGNHYTAIVHFPTILRHMVERIQALAERTPSSD